MNSKQRRKAKRKHTVKFSFDVWDYQTIKTWDRLLTDEEIAAELFWASVRSDA